MGGITSTPCCSGHGSAESQKATGRPETQARDELVSSVATISDEVLFERKKEAERLSSAGDGVTLEFSACCEPENDSEAPTAVPFGKEMGEDSSPQKSLVAESIMAESEESAKSKRSLEFEELRASKKGFLPGMQLQILDGRRWSPIPFEDQLLIDGHLLYGELKFVLKRKGCPAVVDFTDKRNPTMSYIKTGSTNKLRMVRSSVSEKV